jgi:endonuclease/exonuclease/phosphatase family metal-dependent hydrolase
MMLATYNIHACIGSDGHFAPERIVNVLKEMNADITALQEVEQHELNGEDLLDYLGEKTKLIAITGPTLLRHNRYYGNALLTRLPVLVANQIDLTISGREPRSALDVILDFHDQLMRVVATHLGLNPRERHHQTRQLLALLKAPSADISVLMGDLNEWFGGKICVGCMRILE